MLCHCGLVAAAVSKFLLMSIGSVVSLLLDDYNAAVLCLWPQDKALPSQRPIPGPSATILKQTPWACESSGKCPFRGSRGWGHDHSQWEHLQLRDELVVLCQGSFEGTLRVWH